MMGQGRRHWEWLGFFSPLWFCCLVLSPPVVL